MSNSAPLSEITLPPRMGMRLLVGIILLNIGLVGWVVISAILYSAIPVVLLIGMIVSLLSLPFILPGFLVIGPNEGRALVLFGRYRGTIRESGFFWAHPFASKRRVSPFSVTVVSPPAIKQTGAACATPRTNAASRRPTTRASPRSTSPSATARRPRSLAAAAAARTASAFRATTMCRTLSKIALPGLGVSGRSPRTPRLSCSNTASGTPA